MRKYSLVIFNISDEIIDRFNLDLVTNPTGNGFKLNLLKISSDIEDVITKVTHEKNVIKFSVIQHFNAYAKSNMLVSWIQKYSLTNKKMALEYNDGNIIRYCEGKVISLSKTEKDEYGNLIQDMEFQQTTPFFVKRENIITLQVGKVGKKYSFRYPYSYGTNITSNNEITNTYFYDVPLIIILEGAIDKPTITLTNENGVENKVVFTDSILTGEKIIINSAQKKIKKIVNGVERDYVSNIDPAHDTFLRASYGKSILSINHDEASEGFKLTGGWREYRL